MKQLPKIQLTQKPTYKKLAEDVDFFALFEKIEQEFATCFLFESLGEEGKFARYSMIGFAPEHVISARENTLFVDEETFSVTNPYKALREMLPTPTIAREYAGGLVGFIGYDAVNLLWGISGWTTDSVVAPKRFDPDTSVDYPFEVGAGEEVPAESSGGEGACG